MHSHQFVILQNFPEPAFSNLKAMVFADFGEESQLLSEVLSDEASRRPLSAETLPAQEFRIGAFSGDSLIGWSYACAEGSTLHMINSGVLPEFRRRRIYSEMVKSTIAYANAHGFTKIVSRHLPSNNGVIIPKLRLGFMVSAFEYSEVYGPLVHLSYLVAPKRLGLYLGRSRPIVPVA